MLRLLGPPELVLDGEVRDIGGPRQRVVLCALALKANRVALMDELIDAVWDDSPPPTARSQIHICIARIRKLFGEGGQPGGIHTRPPGYLLEIPPEDLDSAVFSRQVEIGRSHADAGRLVEAAQALRDGLALWRGPALAGVRSEVVRRNAAVLEQQRFAALEERVRLDLALGRHRETSGELAALVDEFPLSEPLYELFMLALYRSGQQAEALEVSRRAHAVLVEELGIEPGGSLRSLATAILNRDPSLDLPATPGGLVMLGGAVQKPAAPLLVPRQLPHSIADFAGREQELDEIKFLLSDDVDAGTTPYAMRIVVVSGKGGVGKSTLAIRVAHEVEHLFPDGQLYADLGAATSETDITAMLARFLGSLGVSGSALPEDLAARAELYRSRVAGKQMLIVLDYATSEEQILPLLPGTDGCAVIVTSRLRLDGLYGAHQVDVDVFRPDTCMELLARIVGRERVDAEPDAALQLIDFCGGLPLALRIAGARLASKPHWLIATLVRRLNNHARGLDELSYHGVELRSNIALTHELLRSPAKRLFALGALIDAPDFPAWTAAALLDTDLSDAEDTLEILVDARLLDTVRYTGEAVRFRYHNLIRVYALEQLTRSVPASVREGAQARVLGGWLALAEQAHRKDYGGDFCVLHGDADRWRPVDDPGGGPIDVPADWWEAERQSLVAAVRQAAAAGIHELCWDLALTSISLFEVKGCFDDWRETAEVGLAATTIAGNETGRAAMLYSLGGLHMSQRRLDDAQECFAEALSVFRATGNTHGCALVLRNSAIVDRFRGHYAAMASKCREALGQMRQVGDVVGEAHILQSLARYLLDEGDLDQARHHLDDALKLCLRVGYRRGEAMVLNRFAELYLRTDLIELAKQALNRVLLIVRDLGDRTGESFALYGLGIARRREGRLDNAETTLLHAIALAEGVGERMIEGRARYGLGEIGLARGTNAVAAGHLARALAIFSGMGSRLWHAKTLVLLSEVRAADGDVAAARGDLDNADRLLSEVDQKEAGDLRAQLRLTRAALPVGPNAAGSQPD
ncbi:AfsR/SARP family transcriptional regulator [Actinocrispum wychmicini]|uniref:DNA-binding SARP family transcriptional activator n=1 Tax=Actinocrispum wychmicini TaxID=1213861 RepID=A0A4R2IWW0_9PSEU|nr:BTAD domain-containing putative transcriptional regulator [Actinocrispum wychmicini]TCO47425.1 DNA-binding SARP family transcriptional activator [Actinocrispum wychmicini]